MKAIYQWERKHLPIYHGRVSRLRAKAIVRLASSHFNVQRPLVIGGRWHGGGTYHRQGKWIRGEYIARPIIRLTFSRCYGGVLFHELAHHLQYSETGKTADTLAFKNYLLRVWRWAYEQGIARRIFTARQLEKIKQTISLREGRAATCNRPCRGANGRSANKFEARAALCFDATKGNQAE